MNDMIGTEQLMQTIANGINEFLKEVSPDVLGFALLVFPFGEPGMGNYCSNTNREDMIIALREAADRLEKNEFIPKTEGEA